VDEVVEGVAGGVAAQVRLEPGIFGLLAAGQHVRPAQLRDPPGQGRIGHGQDAPDCHRDQVLLGRRLRLALAGGLGPVGEGRRPVFEAQDQLLALLAVLQSQEVRTRGAPRRQEEDAILALGGLDVAVLALSGVHQPEVRAHGVLRVVRPQAEAVVPKVLAGLDVVLVRVGPVQLDLFALVGDRVDAGLVDALAEEVAVRVVAAEEAEQVVVDLPLQGAQVNRLGLEPGAEIFYLRGRLGVHPQTLGLLHDLGQFLLDLGLVRGLVLAEGCLHLWQQVLVEEPRHLGTLRVHDAIESEVQVGLVELEQLLQEVLQLLILLAHPVSRPRALGAC